MSVLPCNAAELVPHCPPMLFISQLLERDLERDTVVAEAVIPALDSLFWGGTGLLPEYCIELLAQTMAVGNGWDLRQGGGLKRTKGYLVGLEDFVWEGKPLPGETVRLAMQKTFEFGAVTIMHGRIEGRAGLLAQGRVKVWEDK